MVSSVWEIESWVDEVASTAIKRFYPTALSRNISLPLSDIFSHLLRLVEQNKLRLYWEIRCPECFTTVQVQDSYVTSGEELECPLGHEFELRVEYLFPVFEVSDTYKSYILGSKKKLQNGILRRENMVP